MARMGMQHLNSHMMPSVVRIPSFKSCFLTVVLRFLISLHAVGASFRTPISVIWSLYDVWEWGLYTCRSVCSGFVMVLECMLPRTSHYDYYWEIWCVFPVLFYGSWSDENTISCLYSDYRKWETAIEDWQLPVLKDDKLPEWYALITLVIWRNWLCGIFGPL